MLAQVKEAVSKEPAWGGVVDDRGYCLASEGYIGCSFA